MASTDFKLYQHIKDWNLPSVDPYCLEIQAYLKFVGIQFEVVDFEAVKASPTGELPVLSHNGTAVGHSNIINYLSQKGWYLDYDLQPSEKATISAASQIVNERLNYAMLFNLWIDHKNYITITQKQEAAKYPFPLYLFKPIMRQHEVANKLHHYGFEDDHTAYVSADKVYDMLSGLLRDQPYFFGNKPCSLDAVAFGHLAVVLNAPLPNNTLAELVKKYSNLVDFSKRILDTWFSDSASPAVVFQKSDQTVMDAKLQPITKVPKALPDQIEEVDDEEYPTPSWWQLDRKKKSKKKGTTSLDSALSMPKDRLAAMTVFVGAVAWFGLFFWKHYKYTPK